MTAIEDQLTGSRLDIVVGPDAVLCLDLVLEDVGVDYHDLLARHGGAGVTIDLLDEADGYRIVDALRQHLGTELQSATIYHHDDYTQVVCNRAPPNSWSVV